MHLWDCVRANRILVIHIAHIGGRDDTTLRYEVRVCRLESLYACVSCAECVFALKKIYLSWLIWPKAVRHRFICHAWLLTKLSLWSCLNRWPHGIKITRNRRERLFVAATLARCVTFSVLTSVTTEWRIMRHIHAFLHWCALSWGQAAWLNGQLIQDSRLAISLHR